MPLQNRVTPFGDIVAVDARGMFTGNRGIIHDPKTRTLTKRRWTSRAWITCTCEYKNIRREVMATRSWTELFFLDEATALAAGHRPCFLCRRQEAEWFQRSWSTGNRVALPTAPQMDAILHAERLYRGRKRLHTLFGSLSELPIGAMVARGEEAYVITKSGPLLWRAGGYEEATDIHQVDGVLTPPSTLGALAAGYRPVLHPSATE